VEDVECLGAKLETSPLSDGKLLLQAEINVVDARIPQRPVSRVAKRIGRLPRKSGGIEPQIRTALVPGQDGVADCVWARRERASIGCIGRLSYRHGKTGSK